MGKIDYQKTFGEEISSRFSEDIIRLLDYMTESVTKDLPTPNISIEYLVLSLLGMKDTRAYSLMNNVASEAGLDIIYDRYFQVINETSLSAIKPTRQIKIGQDVIDCIQISDSIRDKCSKKKINSVHVLLSFLGDDTMDEKFKRALNKIGVDYETISMDYLVDEAVIETDALEANIKARNKRPEEPNVVNLTLTEVPSFIASHLKQNKPKVKRNDTPDFCININDKVKEGKINKVVGRDREFKEIIRTLGRKKKNNVILVGGEGVGKTAICEGLAYLIENKEVPNNLIGKEVLSLDMTALIAGTTLRGMFEERVQNLLDTLVKSKKYILFIDNIDSILADKGKNDYDISSMLSNVLENGEVQTIGTSTYKGYRNTFDKNPSLSRKFQKMQIDAPDTEESLEILKSICGSYEDFHRVKYTDEALQYCVNLAEKYITDRNLPDSAIDIMDEAGSDLNSEESSNSEIVELRNSINEKREKIAQFKKLDDYGLVDKLTKESKELVAKMISLTEEINEARKENPPVVEKERILDIVSDKTGIPLSKLNVSDMQRLSEMEERLKKDVIGQDEAVSTVTKALKRNRVGLRSGRTMGSFLLLGPTGTGKTLLAKKIAQEIFGDEKALVRFDMSEYMDKTSVNKLIGANPGYVGYEEGGLMTESIKNKKHCVLLLDEIEKADPEVYNMFLQVFDEGFLTDNSGQKIDFKNVIIILTSNVGVKSAIDFGNGIGFDENVDENRKKILSKELKKKFPPEFINRLDNIVYFNRLTENDLKTIISIEMKKVEKKIISMGSLLTYGSDAIDYIYNKIQDEKEYGARPIIRAIQDEFEDRITDTIIEKNYVNCHTFEIKIEGDWVHIY